MLRDEGESGLTEDGNRMFRPEFLGTVAMEINKAAGVYYWPRAHSDRNPIGGMPVVIVRPFTDAQIAKWSELEACRAPGVSSHSWVLYGKPEGLWRRMDGLTAQVKAEVARVR